MITNHGTIAAYLDKDAATIRNNVLAASGSISNFGELNTAWKNLNRCLNLSSSVEKYVATTTNGYEFLAALSQSILAITTSIRVDTQITSSQGSGGGGACLRPILCPDGTVYCPPYGATNAGFYYLPNTNQFITASGQASIAANQYVSAVLQPDGKVFCAPYFMTTSRVYDPETKSTTFKGKFAGGGSFAGGCQLPNGKIFLNPYNASYAIIWDPLTETTSSSTGLAYTPAGISHGCVLAANGKVYSIPFGATKMYVYDYRTNTTVTASGLFAGSSAFLGGVLLPNGKIFFNPYTSTTARIYDPETDTTTTPSASFPGANAYLGGVLMLDGRILLIPANQTKPGFYDYRTDTYSTGSIAWHAGSFGFYGGILMQNGKVFGCGYQNIRNQIFTPNYVSSSTTLALSTFLNKA